MNRSIKGLFCTKRRYTINGVTYQAISAPAWKGNDMPYHLARCITSDIAPLTLIEGRATIPSENVCPAAGKED